WGAAEEPTQAPRHTHIRQRQRPLPRKQAPCATDRPGLTGTNPLFRLCGSEAG
ncbi:hypothetical protein LSTR_LSTR015477, partial [Laodelphax striatellus]